MLDMAGFPECPVCEPRRCSEWQAEYEKYKQMTVAQVPSSRWRGRARRTRRLITVELPADGRARAHPAGVLRRLRRARGGRAGHHGCRGRPGASCSRSSQGTRLPGSSPAWYHDVEVARGWFEDMADDGVEGLVVKGAAQRYKGGVRSW